jgi:hypothetical protein
MFYVLSEPYEGWADKINGEDLFDKLDTNKLNTHLKNIMPQLTAKVFRTYNASITLDTLVCIFSSFTSVSKKKGFNITYLKHSLTKLWDSSSSL